MKLEFSRQIFWKYSNVKFHENPPSGSRVVPCGQTDGRTEMTKLLVAFCNFASVSTNDYVPTALADRSLYVGTDRVFCEAWNVQGYSKWFVGVLTTCHTQYTWDRSICIFLFNRTTLQHNTQRSQQTCIIALDEIQTHNLSKRTTADPRLRPRAHWGRQLSQPWD
jgi:hypothetical protein